MTTNELIKRIIERYSVSLRPQMEMFVDLIDHGHHQAAADVSQRMKDAMSGHADFLMELAALCREQKEEMK